MTPGALGRNHDQAIPDIPQAARRVALGNRWMGPLPGFWASEVLPPASRGQTLAGTSERDLGWQRNVGIPSGQRNVLPSNKGQAEHVILMTRRNV